MKRIKVLLCSLLVVPLLLSLGVSRAAASVTVEPGETVTFGSPDGCFKDVNDCGFFCDVSFKCQPSPFYRIDVLADVSGVETGSAVGWAFSEFTVSGSEETDVSAFIRAKARWSGLLIIQAAFDADVSIRGEFQLYDMTAGRLVDSQVFIDEKCGGTAIIAYDCNDDVVGDEELALPVTVIRGHTYQIRLKAVAVARVAVGVGARVDFDAGGFIQLLRLEPDGPFIELRLARDPFAEIDALAQRVGNLETALDQLLSEFEAHQHTYLTGSGVGHNNTEAATTPPIPDDIEPPIPEDAAEIGPDPEAPTTISGPPLRLDAPVPQRSGDIAIRYNVAEVTAPVTLMVHDVAGRVVRTLSDEFRHPGDYRVSWDRRDDFGRIVAPGVYLLKVQSGAAAATKKLVLTRR